MIQAIRNFMNRVWPRKGCYMVTTVGTGATNWVLTRAPRRSVIQAIRTFWAARQRAIDMKILWPACKEITPDRDRAKAAFAAHAFNDRAWLVLGEEEIKRRIDALY